MPKYTEYSVNIGNFQASHGAWNVDSYRPANYDGESALIATVLGLGSGSVLAALLGAYVYENYPSDNKITPEIKKKTQIIEQLCRGAAHGAIYEKKLDGLSVSDRAKPEEIRKTLGDKNLTKYKICVPKTLENRTKQLIYTTIHLNNEKELEAGAILIEEIKTIRAIKNTKHAEQKPTTSVNNTGDFPTQINTSLIELKDSVEDIKKLRILKTEKELGSKPNAPTTVTEASSLATEKHGKSK